MNFVYKKLLWMAFRNFSDFYTTHLVSFSGYTSLINSNCYAPLSETSNQLRFFWNVVAEEKRENPGIPLPFNLKSGGGGDDIVDPTLAWKTLQGMVRVAPTLKLMFCKGEGFSEGSSPH